MAEIDNDSFKLRISNEKFADLKARLQAQVTGKKVSERNLEIAEKVLVKGESAAEVMRSYGMQRANFYRVLRDVHALANGVEPPSRTRQKQVAERQPGKGDGWKRILVLLPDDRAEQVRNESKMLVSQWQQANGMDTPKKGGN